MQDMGGKKQTLPFKERLGKKGGERRRVRGHRREKKRDAGHETKHLERVGGKPMNLSGALNGEEETNGKET